MAAPALVIRFVLSAAVGIFAAFGVGALATPEHPRSNIGAAPIPLVSSPGTSPSSVAPGSPGAVGSADAPGSGSPVAVPADAGPFASFQLTGDGGDPVAFGITPVATPPEPVSPLPPDGRIQLVAFVTWLQGGGDQSEVRPPWWNSAAPRVAALTQFDGGPFQNANCTLAAGAMLARLTYGIVTTGSQLRSLQDDQDGGTSLYDLNTAMERGWGVRFSVGALTPLQFRALIYGGAGAVLAGFYSQIPLDLRLQKDFTAGHGIYIDDFRPAGASGPAAYYVIDPIGRPWQGYRGAWWPAAVIESFATSLGGGLMDAAWGFAGGATPTKHPILPPEGYPAGAPRPSLAPGSSPSSEVDDPMPTGDVGVPAEIDPGTTDPPAGAAAPGGGVTTGGGEVSADPTYCAQTPRPPACPPGLLGTVLETGIQGDGAAPPTGLPLPTTATGPPGGTSPPAPGSTRPPWIRPHLLWATLVATGTYQVIYAIAAGASLDVWYWATGVSNGSLHHVPAELANLGGQTVMFATVTVDPTQRYSFVASGSARDIRELSELGSFLAAR